MGKIIGEINFPTNSRTLVSFEHKDDAGVYELTPDLALVQTVDFITPVVDDPYIYGQIAAANSLSDIFAMGATVCTALNIVAYDNCNVSREMLREILKGGADKVREAGGVLIGGHTIEDIEMKYGLSVTGIVHPDKILRNNNIQPGDKLILTKPLGLGVISTAIKADMVSDDIIEKAAFHMSYLNKTASELAVAIGVNAMTDVTGFGLLGHLSEMIDSGYGIDIYYDQIPIIEGSLDLSQTGLFPSGSYKNREYFQPGVKINNNSLDDDRIMLLYDAQTSGGLLISVPEEKAIPLLDKLKTAGLEWCSIIGNVAADSNSILNIY